MKKFSLALFAVAILTTAGCSKTEKSETSVKPQSTPNVERLKSDSERLQQATNAAAEQRKREQSNAAQSSATRGPKADLSPRTVPPESPNPSP